MLLIGLMSGTSADGIDATLVEIEGEGRGTRIRPVHFVCVPYSEEMRHEILASCRVRGADSRRLCVLNAALGEAFAEAALTVAAGAGVAIESVEAIASHGQTVWHQPEPLVCGGRSARGTLQLGDAAIIATRTGRKVVSDFRAADMAAGGEGAPLVPYFDWSVLTSDTECRAVLNIGGIANITYLPRNARREEVIAFDTGPGNMVMDYLVRDFSLDRQQFDEAGAWAARGTPNRARVEAILDNHFYFAAPPPKSTGREMFGDEYAAAVREQKGRGNHAAADLIATMALLTVESIGKAIGDFLLPHGRIDRIIVGGGGSRNQTLMNMLRERLAPARLTTHAEFGVPDDGKEAIAFALLAYETLHGRPSNIPSATGASRSVILGSITPSQS